MWIDDDHAHFVRPNNEKEFEEIIAPLILYKKNDKNGK